MDNRRFWDKARSQRGATLGGTLGVALSLLVLVSTLFGLPAQADLAAGSEAQDLVAELNAPAPEQEGEPLPDESEAEAVDEAAVKQPITLEQAITSADGRTYTVRVTYGEDANIPEGAELSVMEVNQYPDDWGDEQKQANEYKDRPLQTEQLVDAGSMDANVEELLRALELGEDDQLLWRKFLRVTLVADGVEITPTSEVQVEVETSAIAAQESDTLEVARLAGDESVAIQVQNATGTKEGEDAQKPEELVSRVSFVTTDLGEVGLAQVVQKKFAWQMYDTEVSVFGARSVNTTPYEVPLGMEYLKGLRLAELFGVTVEPVHTFDTTLWMKATPAADARDGFDAILCYRMNDSQEAEQLFGKDGTSELVTFKAGDLLALVWDSGFRETVLESGDVTVAGSMPEGTTAQAQEVTSQHEAQTLLDDAADAQTVAAYDLSLAVNETPWTPSNENPVRVVVSDDGIKASDESATYEVLHVGEDGSATELVSKADDGSIAFDATDDGTFVVLALANARRVAAAATQEAASGETITSSGIWDNAEGKVISKELTDFHGDLATYTIVVNSEAAQLNGDNSLTLRDTFNNNQAIIYSTINVSTEGGDVVTYDFSDNTGVYTIPDATSTRISYTTRVSGSVGDEVTITNTATLGTMKDGSFVEGASAKYEGSVNISPTGSDIQGQNGVYAIDLYAYADGHMEQGLEGATFRLLDSNMRQMTYAAGDNLGEAITFTTGSDGSVKIALSEDEDGLTIHKNTVYYLEMVAAPYQKAGDGYTYYKKDSTYYSFIITDDADYSYGGVYSYYNGDTLKVRCYPEAAGVNVTKRFSGNYNLTDEQKNAITFILQKEDLTTQSGWVDVESHTYDEFSYGSMNFNAGREGGAELDDNATYRVIEKSTLPSKLEGVVDVQSEVEISYQQNGDPIEDDFNEFFVDPDDKLAYSYDLTFTNTYVEHKLTIVTLNEDTGATLQGAKYQVYKADGNAEVATYTSDSDGSLIIRKGDGHYSNDTLYYAVETAASEGYILPSNPQKVYFYFAENGAAIPDGVSAVDLTNSYDTVTIANAEAATDVPVTTVWGTGKSGVWPSEVGKVVVGLYKSIDGASATAVTGEDNNALTVTLTSSKNYDARAFKGLPAQEDGKDVTYSVMVEKVEDASGSDITGQYASTASVSGTGWHVVNLQDATSVTVQKTWLDLNGAAIDDASAKPAVTFDLYRTTQETDKTGLSRSELKALLGSAAPVRSGLTLSQDNGWSTTVDSIEKEDAQGNAYCYFALEHGLDNQEDTYTVASATDSQIRTLTISNKQTPTTVVISVDDIKKVYGESDPGYSISAHVQDDDSTVNVADAGDQGAYTATVTDAEGNTRNLEFSVVREAGESVGTYAITPTGEASQNGYRVVFEPATLTINPAQVTITAGATKAYGDTDPSLVSVEGLANGETQGVLSFEAAREAGEDVGSYPITLAGETKQGNYTVTYVTGGVFTITSAPVTVTAVDASKAYGSDDPDFTAEVTGLKNDDGASVISYELTREVGEDVGAYAINASGDKSQGNYTVTYVPGTFAISPATINVVVQDAEKTYGDADPEWEVEVEGLQGADEQGTLSSELDSQTGERTYYYVVEGETLLSFKASRKQGESVGEYAITLSKKDEPSNYVVSYGAAKLAISPAELIVTAKDSMKAIGVGEDPLLSATVTGWKNGDDASEATYAINEGVVTWTYKKGNEIVLTFSLQREPGEEAEDYPITVTGDTNQSNYVIEFSNGIFGIVSVLDVDVSQTLVDHADANANPVYTYTAKLDIAGTGLTEYSDNGFEYVDGVPTLKFSLPYKKDDGTTSSMKTLEVPAGSKLTVTQSTENDDYTTAMSLDANPYVDPDGFVCKIGPVNVYHEIVFAHSRISLPVAAWVSAGQTEDGATALTGGAVAMGIPSGTQTIDADFADEVFAKSGYELPTDMYYMFDHASLYTSAGVAIDGAKGVTGIQYDREQAKWKYSVGGDYTDVPEGAQLVLFYLPKYVCKVGTEKFFSLSSAMAYVIDNAETLESKATIEMLIDNYSLRSVADAVTIPVGYDITITTATTDYEGTGTASIGRGPNYTSGSLFTNKGTLTFDKIVLDGKSISTNSALVSNVSTTVNKVTTASKLIVGEGSTLRNALGGAIQTNSIATVNGTIVSCSAANGGAVNMTSGTVELNGEITDCKATNGGAIYMTGGTLAVNSDLTGNSAVRGGAVYMTGGTLTANKAIANNSATNGGAVYMTGGTLNLNNGDLTQNTAAYGGAVYMTAGTLSVPEGSTIANNSASVDGGAVYMTAGTLNLSGGSVLQNTATNDGVVYMTSGTANVTAGTMSGNTATNGAVFYMEGGTTTIKSGEISGNTASENGGMMYASGGTVTISNGTISGNAATNGNGGAIYYAGPNTVDFSGGTLSGNSAAKGYGGVIYQASGTVNLSGGTIGEGNTAINGAATYTEAGITNISAVTIAKNVATKGGAVGAASAATLAFSGNAVVKDNTMTVDGEDVLSNVYLYADSDSVITTAGLGGSASIGVYVSDDLLSTRCDAGTTFGTYSSVTNNNVTKFTNDRRPSLTAYFYNNKLIWTKPINYIVRYLNYSTDLPSNTNKGSQLKGKTTYYPHSSTNAIYDLVTELMPSYTVSSNYAYANSFANGATTGWYDKYLTDIKWTGSWEDGTASWQFMHYDTDVTNSNTDDTFIIYYSDATYLSITNNSGHTLSVNPLTVLNMDVLQTGYGYPTVVDYHTADTLVPIKDSSLVNDDGNLVLPPSGYVKMLFPGSLGKAWSLSGAFTDVNAGDSISYTLDSLNTSSQKETLSDASSFNLSGAMLSTAGKTYDILFGDPTPICKVEDSDGEHPFSRLNYAWDYIKNNNLHTATIEMLMDYVQPGDDVLKLDSGYQITLTTAAAKGSEAAAGKNYTYTGDDPARATISRDNDNNGAAIIYDATEGSNSGLTLTNLIFDGKALAKTGNGGAVTARNCNVSIDNCYFKGYRAGRGGAVFVARSELLKVTNSQFYDCRSEVNVDKAGGGAIWTTAKNLTLESCEFRDCICTGTSNGQGGAVFHNIVDGKTFGFKEFDYDGSSASYASGYSQDTRSTVTNCQFYDCYVNGSAGGGMESDAMYVMLRGCLFKDCHSDSGHGAGGLQIYARDQKEPKEDWYSLVEIYDTVFDNCRAENATWSQNQGSGGAIRCTAYETKLYNCQFKDAYCKARGGAISISNGNANALELYGCSFDNCSTSDFGGALSCPVITLVVGDYTAEDGTVTHTTFKNCTATNNGGAINQQRNVAGSSATLNGASFENCTSTNGQGGAIYANGIKTLTLTGREDTVTFKNCAAAGDGGAVYHATNGPISEKLAGCSFENCVSSSSGGAAYLEATGIEITDTTVKNCNAVNQGGGLRIAPGSNKAVLKNCVISDCYATATTSKGGAFYNNNNQTVTFDGGRIDYCSAASGGGIYMNSGTLNYYGAELSECYASGNGGGIYAGGTVNAYGAIRYCVAQCGGGIYTSSNQNYTIDDEAMVIEHCVAKAVTLGVDGSVAVAKGFISDNLGGGIYQGGGTLVLSNDSVIRDCEAYNGGGIYQSGGNINNGISGTASSCGLISDCSAVNGGAVYMTGGNFNHRNGSGIVNCTASGAGGGVYVAGGTFYNYDQAAIESCNAIGADRAYTETNRGGGIYQGGGEVFLRGNVGAKIDKCSAYDGGGIYHGAGKFELGNSAAQTGTVISGNVAQNNGGGVYHMSGTMTYKRGNNDPEIKENTAQNGAGLFCVDGTILNMSGGIIDANHALIVGGGIAVGGPNTRLNFSSLVKVQGNTMGSEESPVTCNIYLDQDSNAVINNSGTMDAASYIGVYAADSQDAGHGVSGMPFATYASNTSNFNRYRNDRRPYLYGVIGDSSKKQIKWAVFVCKITDGDGNLLYKDAGGTPAVYETVENQVGNNGSYAGAAFTVLNVARTPELYDAEGTLYETNEYQVQMLVPSYNLDVNHQSRLTENGNGRKVTLTTASSEPDEMGFKYTGDARFAATIIRTANASSMIYLFNSNNWELTLRNITLDGGGYASTSEGGIVRVNGSNAVVLDEGATLKNNRATGKHGGAVYVEGGASVLTMNKGSIITNCSAGTNNGGGVHLSNGTFNMNGGSITGCTANNGGGVYLNNSAKLYMNGESKAGAVVKDNKATAAGGGIYLSSSNNDTQMVVFSGYCTVLNNTVGDTTRCNVQLDVAKNTRIQSNGLDSRSEIGIYTPGDGTNTNSIYYKHGLSAKPFGTRQQDNDRFYCFVNDRDVALRGVKGAETDKFICWEGRPLLRVGKTVISDLEADASQEFSFSVQLELTEEQRTKYFNAFHNIYGDMDFDSNGKATLTLKNDEAATASFPYEFFTGTIKYTVTEEPTSAQSSRYLTTVWNSHDETSRAVSQSSGVLGENFHEGSSTSTSLSDVMFTNYRTTGDLAVSKKVEGRVKDSDQSFTFNITLDDTSINKVYNATNTGDGTVTEVAFLDGVANFSIKNGETLTITGLPTDLEYTVEEALTSTQKLNIRTQIQQNGQDRGFALKQTGKIGESESTVTNPYDGSTTYKSTVEFTNEFLEIVCKITNRSRDLLYFRDASGTLQEAIYSHLEDAFDQINAGNLRTSTNGTVSGVLRIEMVVPDYAMRGTATLDSGKNVILSTAETTDDKYPYHDGDEDDTNNVATVFRGFESGSMIVDNGTLTLDSITLDGASSGDDPIAATTDGGIVQVNDAVKLTVNSGATLQNSVVKGNGGAIYLPAGASLVMNGTIDGCSANAGGGVYAADGFTTITTTGTISDCKATAGDGGALFASTGTSVSLNAGTQLAGNSATGNGGAVYSSANVVLRGVVGSDEMASRSGNSAAGNGGGIYMDGDATFNMYAGGALCGNTATNGGGLWTNGTARIANGTFDGNSAAGNGGGMYAGGDAVVAISGTSSFIENQAKQGGAVYDDGGSVTLSAGSMTENSASEKGGAVYVNTGTFTMSGGSMSDNASPEGAVSTGDGAILAFLGNAVVRENTANDGVTPMNVYLGYDSNAIITTSGLGTNAYIGVYVADGDPEDESVENRVDNPIYCEHGLSARNFGTYTGSNVSAARLNKFVNDRDTSLTGMNGGPMGESSNNFVAWNGKGLNLVVSKVNAGTETGTAPVGGVSFSLANSQGEVIWTGKSDETGLVRIPWGAVEKAGGNAVSFAPFSSYTLRETASSDETVRPAGHWTLQIARNNTVTWNVVPSESEVNQTLNLALAGASSGTVAVLGDTLGLYNDVQPTITFDANGTNIEGAVQPKLANAANGETQKTETVGFNTTETSHAYTIDEANPTWDSHVFKHWATMPTKPVDEEGKELSDEELSERGYFEYERSRSIVFYRGTETQLATTQQGLSAGDMTLYAQWDEVVCKITDRDGTLLYLNGSPAVYSTLEAGFESFNTTSRFTYQNGSRATARRIEMLVGDYELNNPLVLARGKTALLTTAPADDTDGYAYTGVAGTACVITRGDFGDSMLTVNTSLTLMNITLDGGGTKDGAKAVDCSGGIVHMSRSDSVLAIASGATLQNSQVSGSGGIVNMDGGTLTISNGAVLKDSVAYGENGGGAIYASAGTLVLNGGTISGNQAAKGAGIYLSDKTTLRISGAPSFDDGNFATSDLEADATNGGDSYTRARQDIFLEESHENAPSSIVVTGELTGQEGSIWVWADSEYHNKQLMPFAKTEGVSFTEDSAAQLRVFRNAQPDSVTENGTDSWLYGTTEGETEGYIYWNGVHGSRKVILRKVGQLADGNYESLSGAKFRVTKIQDASATVVTAPNGDVLDENLCVSDSSGVFWVGELNYGEYYFYESTTPDGYVAGKWFLLTVNENGATIDEVSG